MNAGTASSRPPPHRWVQSLEKLNERIIGYCLDRLWIVRTGVSTQELSSPQLDFAVSLSTLFWFSSRNVPVLVQCFSSHHPHFLPLVFSEIAPKYIWQTHRVSPRLVNNIDVMRPRHARGIGINSSLACFGAARHQHSPTYGPKKPPAPRWADAQAPAMQTPTLPRKKLRAQTIFEAALQSVTHFSPEIAPAQASRQTQPQ